VPSDDNDDTSGVGKDIPVAGVDARSGDEVATRTGRPPGARLIGLSNSAEGDAEIMLLIEALRRDRDKGTPRPDDTATDESRPPPSPPDPSSTPGHGSPV